MNRRSLLLPLAGVVALTARPADASSSASGEEYLSLMEYVEPNILFVLDMSKGMGDPCPSDTAIDTGTWETGSTGSTTTTGDGGGGGGGGGGGVDTGGTTTGDGGGGGGGGVDTGGTTTSDGGGGGGADTGGASDAGGSGGWRDTGLIRYGASTSSSSSTDPCIEVVADAVDQVTQHFDWARYGVVGTSDDSSYGDEFYPIAPIGSSYADISSALSGLSAHSTKTRNLAESLASLWGDYWTNTTPDDGVDDDGDGFDPDWNEAPIEYWCQENHVITIALNRPYNDQGVSTTYRSSLSTDVKCRKSGITTGTDQECLYDNVVYYNYDQDARSDLSGTQNVTVHTIGLGIPSTSIAENLFGNASDQIGGAGVYTTANSSDEILSAILTVLTEIREGVYSRSTPVISSNGNYLVYAYYEIDGGDPLAQGHVRAYEIDTDETSATYGQVLYDGPSEYGGAVWDGGTLLVSRPVTSAESNPDDRDGFGKRDIYTFFEPAVPLMASESTNDRRQGFDYEFVTAVGSDATALSKILDTTSSVSPPCADDLAYDLSKDDCLVDSDDLQALVDFARGLPEAEYRYLDQERGKWKLGDSPHSVPVIVEATSQSYSSGDPKYAKFLDELVQNRDAGTSPDIVLIAANDGMLHAFALEDDKSTADTEEGEELWAWLPGYLLYREHDASWAGRLIDLALYGRTFLFDGSPVVEDVWIDADGDQTIDCDSVPDDCEIRRVVVVQQGKGGPVTLALDITDTNDPKFLWEQTDETDPSAMGYTISRPVIALYYDGSDSTDPRDRWVALWGSGRGVPYTDATGFYESAEANLYMWHVGDDYWGTASVGYQDVGSGTARGDNLHPESGIYGSALDTDGDGNAEYAYVSAALAVVDADSDGDHDTVYFPVTTAYQPTDEGGSGPGDTADPGSTWMYKACLDPENPGEFTFIEFFDPIDDGGLSRRPEVYYSATTSWLSDGSLAVYWGTGTPYDRTSTSDEGYFFAMKDTAPESCSADTMQPMTDCGADGIYTLDPGEGLTGEPIVYGGIVYFSTWVPETDRCDGGTGRVYGIDYETCEPGMDTNGDGVVDSTDDPYVEEADTYVSGLAVTGSGTLFYGTSNPTTDGSAAAVGTISTDISGIYTTATLAWMEVF